MDLSRQADMIKGPEKLSMLIIGAGGIGSNAAYMVACMGIGMITIYDSQKVEEGNIAPQFYGENDVGSKKVMALAQRIHNMTGARLFPVDALYTNQEEQADIVLIAVDSMEARNEIWQQNNIRWQWWLDGRMGGMNCSLITLDARSLEDIEKYEDEYLAWEPGDEPCGLKATSPITKGVIPGHIGRVLLKIVNDFSPPLFIVDNVLTMDEAAGS